jgi:hypothetical protein
MERFWYVLLEVVSNLGIEEQPIVQFASATQRSLFFELVSEEVKVEERGGKTYDEPVSRMTLNEVGGVPTATVP